MADALEGGLRGQAVVQHPEKPQQRDEEQRAADPVQDRDPPGNRQPNFEEQRLEIEVLWPDLLDRRGGHGAWIISLRRCGRIGRFAVHSWRFSMAKAPVRVAVTGAAGQIGYALLFRIASGEMLGKDQPVILQMLEIPDEKAQKALKGVMMELDDCAFPLLHGMVPTADPMVAFKDVGVALLVGARPRGPGMERKDLLEANGKIFGPQGQALDKMADRNVKVLVVGNPANTNCLIAMKNAPSLKPTQFTAMMRLDHNRATSQIAQKVGVAVSKIKKITVWGNHSATQYPDVFQAECDGKKVWPKINDQDWLEKTFIPTVQKRGAAIIEARGLSSAASAANAAVD